MKNGSDEEYLETGGQAFDQSDDVFEKNFGSKKSKDDSGDDKSGGSRGERNDSRNADAKSILGGAEGAAVGEDNDGTEGGINPVRAIENAEDKIKDGFNYVGGKLTSKVKGKKSKKGPIIAIFMMLCGFGGISFASTALAPFALVANGMDQFNVLRTSMNSRHKYFLRYQMDSTRNKPLTKATIFGNEKFKISNKMQKRLSRNGIEYHEVNGVKFLSFEDPDTKETMFITANDDDVGKIPDSADGKTASSKQSLGDAMNSNKNFYNAENTSTRTVKGHIAGWFESLSMSFHKRIKASRNRFNDINSSSSDEDIVSKAKTGGMSESVGDARTAKGDEDDGKKPVSDSPHEEKYKDFDDLDDNDQPKIKQKQLEGTGADGLNANTPKEEIGSRLTSRAKKVVAAGVGTNIACLVLRSYGALNLAISSIQIAKVMNFVTGYLEAIQKTQAGYGSVELAYYQNGLASPGDSYDATGEELVSTNKSAMSARAYNAFFGGAAVAANDRLAKKFNREYSSSYALAATLDGGAAATDIISFVSGFSNSVAAFQACTVAQATMAAVSMGVDIAMLIGTMGVGNIVKKILLEIVQAGAIVAVMTIVGIAIQALIPVVAQLLAQDLVANLAGEDAAYALNSGINMYMGRQMQSNSGGAATEASMMAMYKHAQEVIAEEAEYERSIKSPFDITSKNTFLGSLAYNMIPIGLAVNNSLPGTISKVMSATSTSIATLLPSVSAASDETWYNLSKNMECPALSYYGIVGDAYCNPYYATDFSTMGMDPYDVYLAVGEENFGDDDADGNPQIEDESEIGKYIIACTLRESQLGVVDGNIQSFLSTSNTAVDTVVSGGLGAIPIVGDALDIATAMEEEANLKWNSGAACVADDSNPDWEQNKFYQRYIEDQTYMEAEGIISKSSVTAFVERFYEKHPIDNSIEGVIARYSGMTSEQVDELMGTVEYVAFVSQYNPEYLYPLPADGTEEVAIFFDNEFWQENTNYYVIRNENIFWRKEDYVTI